MNKQNRYKIIISAVFLYGMGLYASPVFAMGGISLGGIYDPIRIEGTLEIRESLYDKNDRLEGELKARYGLAAFKDATAKCLGGSFGAAPIVKSRCLMSAEAALELGASTRKSAARENPIAAPTNINKAITPIRAATPSENQYCQSKHGEFSYMLVDRLGGTMCACNSGYTAAHINGGDIDVFDCVPMNTGSDAAAQSDRSINEIYSKRVDKEIAPVIKQAPNTTNTKAKEVIENKETGRPDNASQPEKKKNILGKILSWFRFWR